MPAVEVAYVEHPRRLRIRADPAADWRRRRKGYSFSHQVSATLPGGDRLRVQVSLLPRRDGRLSDPTNHGAVSETLPPLRSCEFTLEGLHVVVQHQTIECSVQLLNSDGCRVNGSLPWRHTRSGRLRVHWYTYLDFEEVDGAEQGFATRTVPTLLVDEASATRGPDVTVPAFRAELQVLLVVQPGPTHHPDTYSELRSPFASAGLPSLGRRRP